MVRANQRGLCVLWSWTGTAKKTEERNRQKTKIRAQKTSLQAGSFVVDSDERRTLLRL
jgi:hypothetical protein